MNQEKDRPTARDRYVNKQDRWVESRKGELHKGLVIYFET
jgi:hypothetical protein